MQLPPTRQQQGGAPQQGAAPPGWPQPTAAAATSMDQVTHMIQGWPDSSQKAAKAMLDKYGTPNSASDRELVWYDNGPWRKTIVFRDVVRHNFPTPHDDVLLQTIAYRVPIGKFDALQKFDGSLIADRTKGELSSRCASEETNILALNLANDVVTGKRSASDARSAFAKTLELQMAGKTSPALGKLQFKEKVDTADPDRPAETSGSKETTPQRAPKRGMNEEKTAPGVPAGEEQPNP
jgi:hypothetical protein